VSIQMSPQQNHEVVQVEKETPTTQSLARVRNYMIGGLAVVFVMLGGAGVWAARTQIAGAVVASGVVVVESSVKKVQHPTGGVVGEILVKNGDVVKAGDVVMRLDQTVTHANLQLIERQLDEVAVRGARFGAERDNANAVPVPESFKGREAELEGKKILASERTLFESRRDSREGQKSQLKERVGQFDEEIAGLQVQIDAKSKELQLIAQELKGLEELEAKQLVLTSKMVAMRREAARLDGERGSLISSVAQTKGKISEINMQILRIDQDFRTDLMKELRENEARQSELEQKRIAAQDQLKRVDILAPQSGLVHQLTVHTIGGVINPSDSIMLIVPENDKLVIDAKISPQDIERLLNSKSALVRLPAFNSRTTPELEAKLKSVAGDVTTDQQTNEQYYMARVELLDGELAKLGEGNKLLPGMPADVQIRTESRTALSYLVKPLTDQITKGWRER
jgi:HlyD family secretion protein